MAGLGFGATSALVAGLALLGLALVAVAWVELTSRWARLERAPGPGRVVEDEPYALRIRLRGAYLPPPGGTLSDPLLRAPIRVGPRWRGRLEREVHLRGPGRRRLQPARLLVTDPLGLWRRELCSADDGDLVVLPRITPVRLARGEGAALAGGAWSVGALGSAGGITELEVEGLRPYRDGSPASRIHWPAVARTGELIERRLDGGGGSRPLVVLDTRAAARANGEPPATEPEIEGGEPEARARAVRAAASICFELARVGGCELLLPGEGRPLTIDPALRSWPEAHLRVALCGSGAPVEGALASRPGAVIWVSAGGPTPRLLARLGSGSYLVRPGPARGRVAFTVAGCHGRSLAAARGPRSRSPRRPQPQEVPP
jgi:uncharacterized protein (DUF58 family)